MDCCHVTYNRPYLLDSTYFKKFLFHSPILWSNATNVWENDATIFVPHERAEGKSASKRGLCVANVPKPTVRKRAKLSLPFHNPRQFNNTIHPYTLPTNFRTQFRFLGSGSGPLSVASYRCPSFPDLCQSIFTPHSPLESII